ncbi:MAG TPA: bifunctional folylpolyglutamate synthase/dihydrofolate synthase [Firmicutes bacterium]|nr:bifunctional folylpolyglutamate synthase/dihydrofolate synthase [Bacillota bacterium]
MNYTESLEFLHGLGRFGVKPGLARVEALLSMAGNPEKGLNIVHVAGTNGKGSVSSMVESVLRHAGYRTGLYTSPHLVSFTERIKFQGRDIPPWKVAEILTRIKPYVEGLSASDDPGTPTEFEVATAMAFIYFREMQVDFAVIEVGLGGRFDATNVVIPMVSVITHISYDHMKTLGNTLSEIAMEKAGIIKPGVPVVSSPQDPEALQVIEGTCEERRAKLTLVGRDVVYLRKTPCREGTISERLCGEVCDISGRVAGRDMAYRDIRIPLLGPHQVENCATAIAAIEELRGAGVFITDADIRHGVEKVRWPGRFEVVSTRPYVILDGAHNPDGMKRLLDSLEEVTGMPDFTGNVIFVLGLSRDKPGRDMVGMLAHRVDHIIATRARSSRVGTWEPAHIRGWAEEFKIPASCEDDARTAVEKGREIAGPGDLLVVAGSLYLVGEVYDMFCPGI